MKRVAINTATGSSGDDTYMSFVNRACTCSSIQEHVQHQVCVEDALNLQPKDCNQWNIESQTKQDKTLPTPLYHYTPNAIIHTISFHKLVDTARARFTQAARQDQ